MKAVVNNKTERPLFLELQKGGILVLPTGGELTDDFKKSCLDSFQELEFIEYEEVKDTAKDTKTKKVAETVVLPENPTVELLMEKLTIDQMKDYCRQNSITGFSKLNETQLSELIISKLPTE